MSISPPPYHTPIYENGSMNPQWLSWFNSVTGGAAGGSIDAAQVVRILSENLPDGTLDFSVPPILTGFTVMDGFNTIFMQWNTPTYASFDHVEIWRSVSEIFTFAIMAGTTQVNSYGDMPPANVAEQTFYYWVRAVSKAGVKGPFNAVLGTTGKTSADPEYVLGKLAESLNAVSPTFTGPELVFETQTFAMRSKDEQGADKYPFIVDATEGVVIDTAVIKSASITDAKIGSVKADKIIAGTISATIEMTAATVTGGTIRSSSTASATGGIVLQGQTLKVHDNNGVVRVKLGLL